MLERSALLLENVVFWKIDRENAISFFANPEVNILANCLYLLFGGDKLLQNSTSGMLFLN